MKTSRLTGFTLIEMMVTIGISSILFISLVTTIVSIYRANNETLVQTQYVDSARRGIETFVKDARESDYAITGVYPIVTALPHRFSFYADIDPDDITEFIVYELSARVLQKTVYSASGTPPVYSLVPDVVETLASNIHNQTLGEPTFTYYDRHGVEIASSTADFADIRSVRMVLQISLDETATSSSFTLAGNATFRNLLDR